MTEIPLNTWAILLIFDFIFDLKIIEQYIYIYIFKKYHFLYFVQSRFITSPRCIIPSYHLDLTLFKILGFISAFDARSMIAERFSEVMITWLIFPHSQSVLL